MTRVHNCVDFMHQILVLLKNYCPNMKTHDVSNESIPVKMHCRKKPLYFHSKSFNINCNILLCKYSRTCLNQMPLGPDILAEIGTYPVL